MTRDFCVLILSFLLHYTFNCIKFVSINAFMCYMYNLVAFVIGPGGENVHSEQVYWLPISP